MKLIAQPVNRNLGDYRKIKSLYGRTFSRIEKVPWCWLRLKELQQRADFQAFYDQEKFVGLAYTLHQNNLHYLLYLAVNEPARCCGYGTAIMSELKKAYGDDQIVLAVKKPNQFNGDKNQFDLQINFYLQNGFYVTSKELQSRGVVYQVMASQENLSDQELVKLIHSFIHIW